ncbi:hypothetical protein E2C01_054581 [Portunus trituberculatus]|uniref:Uncharacterized protein n=1 Tax=Portunus trituberculatus TaxID=210409 RepID=A0A5B7GSG4_PORTR|nr:hypothetical protein [Portunus trituberculatus]
MEGEVDVGGIARCGLSKHLSCLKNPRFIETTRSIETTVGLRRLGKDNTDKEFSANMRTHWGKKQTNLQEKTQDGVGKVESGMGNIKLEELRNAWRKDQEEEKSDFQR